MSRPVFYLGTHQPSWLWTDVLPRDVDLFVSHRRLDGHRPRRSTYPPAVRWWALDSGGFTELQKFGRWQTSPTEYVAAVRRYDNEIGNLQWAAPQDWMCEPAVIHGAPGFAGTGLSVVEHQRRTVANFIELQDLWYAEDDRESPFMPVLQGYTLSEYLFCWDLYSSCGIDLANYPVVGVGSVCRRQDTDEIGAIMTALRARDPELPIHGFGVKTEGIRRYGQHMSSTDSMSWSACARHDQRPMDACIGGSHINCANCPRYAASWRAHLLGVA